MNNCCGCCPCYEIIHEFSMTECETYNFGDLKYKENNCDNLRWGIFEKGKLCNSPRVSGDVNENGDLLGLAQESIPRTISYFGKCEYSSPDITYQVVVYCPDHLGGEFTQNVGIFSVKEEDICNICKDVCSDEKKCLGRSISTNFTDIVKQSFFVEDTLCLNCNKQVDLTDYNWSIFKLHKTTNEGQDRIVDFTGPDTESVYYYSIGRYLGASFIFYLSIFHAPPIVSSGLSYNLFISSIENPEVVNCEKFISGTFNSDGSPVSQYPSIQKEYCNNTTNHNDILIDLISYQDSGDSIENIYMLNKFQINSLYKKTINTFDGKFKKLDLITQGDGYIWTTSPLVDNEDQITIEVGLFDLDTKPYIKTVTIIDTKYYKETHESRTLYICPQYDGKINCNLFNGNDIKVGSYSIDKEYKEDQFKNKNIFNSHKSFYRGKSIIDKSFLKFQSGDTEQIIPNVIRELGEDTSKYTMFYHCGDLTCESISSCPSQSLSENITVTSKSCLVDGVNSIKIIGNSPPVRFLINHYKKMTLTDGAQALNAGYIYGYDRACKACSYNVGIIPLRYNISGKIRFKINDTELITDIIQESAVLDEEANFGLLGPCSYTPDLPSGPHVPSAYSDRPSLKSKAGTVNYSEDDIEYIVIDHMGGDIDIEMEYPCLQYEEISGYTNTTCNGEVVGSIENLPDFIRMIPTPSTTYNFTFEQLFSNYKDSCILKEPNVESCVSNSKIYMDNQTSVIQTRYMPVLTNSFYRYANLYTVQNIVLNIDNSNPRYCTEFAEAP